MFDQLSNMKRQLVFILFDILHVCSIESTAVL